MPQCFGWAFLPLPLPAAAAFGRKIRLDIDAAIQFGLGSFPIRVDATLAPENLAFVAACAPT